MKKEMKIWTLVLVILVTVVAIQTVSYIKNGDPIKGNGNMSVGDVSENNGEAGNDPSNSVNYTEKEEVNKEEYNIAKVTELPANPDSEDSSRIILMVDVVINNETSVSRLKEIAEEVAIKQKDRYDYSGLKIFFNDRESFIGISQTLGTAEFALKGNINESDNVKPGDYEKLEFGYNLLDKNWEKRPTKKESEIYSAWMKNLIQSGKKNVGMDDAEIAKLTIEQLGTNADKVEKALRKMEKWQLDGYKARVNSQTPGPEKDTINEPVKENK